MITSDAEEIEPELQSRVRTGNTAVVQSADSPIASANDGNSSVLEDSNDVLSRLVSALDNSSVNLTTWQAACTWALRPATNIL